MIEAKGCKIGMAGDGVMSWDALKANTLGGPQELATWAELHIQVLGQLSGAEMQMQGSNCLKPTTETDWALLTDSNGMPVLFSDTAVFKRAVTVPRWIRPCVEGGDQNTNVQVSVITRKPFR